VDLDVSPKQKQKAIDFFGDAKTKHLKTWAITHRETMDGVKIYLDDIGWLMVRAAGTENLLRIYSETSSAATTQQALRSAVEAVGNL